MPKEENLSGLTRSLMLGVSLGAIGLTQVGCAPSATTSAAPAQTDGSDTIVVRSEGEQALCARALRSRAAADVNLLLTEYPNSRCIVPLLSSMPAGTLAGLSPEALGGVSSGLLASLPPNAAASLPVPLQTRPVLEGASDVGDSRY